MKKHTIVIRVPKETIRDVDGIKFFKDKTDNSIFFQSKKQGKPLKNKDNFILQNKEAHGCWITIHKDHFKATYEVTLKELKSLVKVAEKKQAYFDKLDKKRGNSLGVFLIHFSPDLSFAVKKGK